MAEIHAETLIVGGGIIGLTIARELVWSGFGGILLIDKEKQLGTHASGRNSGVLHAGIYYTPDTLKARSCLRGNLLMRQYCKAKGLPLLETGKVIVARGPEEIPVLEELYRRALLNGARVELIDARQLSEIEPNARTCQRALFSHQTAVTDPRKVVACLEEDLRLSGRVKFLLGCSFQDLAYGSTALTNRGRIRFHYFINAAGAHCDRVARPFGVGTNYRMVPFKGIYKKLKQSQTHLVRGNIYPVPDMRNPFLGIHFTRDVEGEVHLGPTAIPAFGRENYGILQGLDPECLEILFRDTLLFFSNRKFRTVALAEAGKYVSRLFYRDAAKLVRGLNPADIEASDRTGIRAQLVDWHKKELVVDFQVVQQGESIHVLNPVSPGFTSSMDLARTVVTDYLQPVRG